MVYTCGYWKNAKTLAEAQEAKLDLVVPQARPQARHARARPRLRLGRVRELRRREVRLLGRRRDAVEGPGRARQRDVEAPDVELRLCDYRDVTGTFDRVVVDRHDGARRPEESPRHDGGDRPLPGRRRRRARSTRSPTTSSLRHGTPFVEKYIFPNAVAPSLAQIGRAIEGLFVLEDLHNIGPDYDPTLMAWWENFDRTYPEITAQLRPALLPDVEVLPARRRRRVARARRPALPARADEDRPHAARLPRQLSQATSSRTRAHGSRGETARATTHRP